MKKKHKLLIILGTIVTIVAVVVVILIKGNIQATAEYSSEYNKIFGEFAADTANKLLKDKESNTCYSPVSLFGALSMFSEISVGNTQSEVLGALGFDSIEELENNYDQMLADIDISYNDSKIVLANSLWLEEKDVNEEIKSVVAGIEEKMNCEFFIKDELNSDEVNKWVEGKTNGLIPNIIESVDKDMILVNSLYYKSAWRSSMGVSAKKEDFFLQNGDTVDVNYLCASRKNLFYKIEDKYTYVEVPLDEGKFLLVLPDENVELSKLLDENVLNDVMATSSNNTGKKYGLVNIKFPKFKIEYKVDGIEATLTEMGASQLFDLPSLVGGLTGDDVEIMQKTKFIVDEDGIEAAAATGMSMMIVGIEDIIEVDLEITYDRPFLYVLMQDGVPLFIGTVYNPVG